jgi:hypothetical protein
MRYRPNRDNVLSKLRWYPVREGRWTLWCTNPPSSCPPLNLDRLNQVIKEIRECVDWDKASRVPIDEAICSPPYMTDTTGIIPWKYEYKDKEE